MKNFTMFCSPGHKYELDEHPKLSRELFGDLCEIKESNKGIALYTSNTDARVVVYKPREHEVVFAKKVPFLHQAYFIAEDYEMTYALKEFEFLQHIFEDMGAREIILSYSFEKLEKVDREQSGGIFAKILVDNPDPTKSIQVDSGINAENQTQKDQEAKVQDRIKMVLNGKKKSGEQLREYITQNNVDIEGFPPSIKKAISDYLINEEVNKREIEISHKFEEFYKEKREFIARIGANINMGQSLSIIPEIKAKINSIQHRENKLHYSLKIVF